MKKYISKTDFAFAKIKSVYLVDANGPDLMRNKRVFEMLNIAEQVFTFQSASEALLSLNQPGLVPEIMIVSERMSDTDIKGFMVRYENLPQWLTNACTVYRLLSPISMDSDCDEDFNHIMFRNSVRKPFHPHKLKSQCGSIDEFLN